MFWVRKIVLMKSQGVSPEAGNLEGPDEGRTQNLGSRPGKQES